jgi:hypothetical protein
MRGMWRRGWTGRSSSTVRVSPNGPGDMEGRTEVERVWVVAGSEESISMA